MREKFAGEVEVPKQQEIGIQRTEAMIVGVRYFMQILQLSGLFGAAIWLVTRGALSPGDAIAFITICANIRTDNHQSIRHSLCTYIMIFYVADISH